MAYPGLPGRHERAHLRQNHDQRGLPEHRGFSGHVGAGEQPDIRPVRPVGKRAVIGDEWLAPLGAQGAFDYVTPYDDFDLYWDQSPISGVEDMDTPVLYLHGEADPTVNWEQGLEWYNALRFLGKPIIWLSYPDEGHGLSKLENRIDFQMRLQQFFGHHLRGEPAPGWMTDGVPQLAKPAHMRESAPGPIRWGGRSGG